VGQFSFAHIEGGTYVVELLGENGKVVTVGQAFVIGQGETVATFVRLGTKVPWFTGFFQNAATAAVSTGAVFENASSAVMSAAGALGITPLAAVQQCVSPPCN